MTKDWVGNKKSIYTTIGASNHTKEEREKNDYYATDPKAVELLLEKEKFSHYVWECACGEGHLSKVLIKKGYDVKSSDIVDRGFQNTEIINFLEILESETNTRDIITNPPYKFAQEFVEQALKISRGGVKIAMFLKLTFLEGKSRKQMFLQNPPTRVYVFSSRIQCGKNGVFTGSSAVAYAWFIWEKGIRNKPIIEWIN